MHTYTFTVRGNQEKPDGNPIPYFRTTQKSLWAPQAQRYFAFKEHIVTALLTALPEHRAVFDRELVTKGKPLTLAPGEIAFVDIAIHWAPKGTHGDPDNIFKAVNDALFNDDRNVYGSMKPGQPLGYGQIDIKVSIYPPL